jgi:uncharacterized protein YlxP (DUF503 family)
VRVFVGVLQVELAIPGARSLKEKRSVLKSLLERTRRKHGVAAAESHLQKLLNGLERERDAQVVAAQIDVL